MIAFTDSAGTPLSGDGAYRLRLPPNIPAANFWSVTLYDAENSSGLANGQPFPSLGSRDKPAQNADGSTDLYLGPQAPEGKAGNWLASVPGKGLRADRSRHRQETEARRFREAEVAGFGRSRRMSALCALPLSSASSKRPGLAPLKATEARGAK